jgi:hypothetical protein
MWEDVLGGKNPDCKMLILITSYKTTNAIKVCDIVIHINGHGHSTVHYIHMSIVNISSRLSQIGDNSA